VRHGCESLDHQHDHDHEHGLGGHGHSHGLVDRWIIRSRAGLKAVALSLALLAAAALAQVAIFVFTVFDVKAGLVSGSGR